VLIVWVVLGLLVAMAVITWWQPTLHYRAVGLTYRGIGLTGVAPVLYLAAWPCAVVAALAADWPAFAIAVALVISQLTFSLPSMHPWSTAAASTGPWRLRLYVHNVLYTNTDLTAVAAQVEDEAPDIVAIVELSHDNVDSLRSTHVLDSYPFHSERLADDGYGYGVWSKVPMTDAQFQDEPDRTLCSAVLRPAGRTPITFLLVHTIAPVAAGHSMAWARDLDVIHARVRDTNGPLVLAGDFNATIPMRRLRRVVRAGQLRDAATTTGRGWQLTWPSGWRFVPGLMRLDHVFHSGDLTVTDYRLGAPTGSDHRPLLVTVADSRRQMSLRNETMDAT
jgi:endonuclease/exonuclease/phosphatase (EEP) superfamily protein YafD